MKSKIPPPPPEGIPGIENPGFIDISPMKLSSASNIPSTIAATSPFSSNISPDIICNGSVGAFDGDSVGSAVVVVVGDVVGLDVGDIEGLDVVVVVVENDVELDIPAID